MKAVYEDQGSEQLTGKKLKEIAQALPPEAKILSFNSGESQKDGWFWSVRAICEVPTKATIYPPYHGPGVR